MSTKDRWEAVWGLGVGLVVAIFVVGAGSTELAAEGVELGGLEFHGVTVCNCLQSVKECICILP